MIGRKLRIALLSVGTSLSLLAAPCESKAFWDLFHCHRAAPATTYMPVAAPCCNTCPAPVVANCCSPCQQVCNYVPQTCYRTVYVNMPVTACQPVCTTDPCTGCPRTAMRPVTTYVAQPRLVPYTTYRPVMTSCCSPCTTGCATGGCATGGCGTGACGTPSLNYYPPSQPAYTPAPSTGGCSSCASGGYSSYNRPATSGMPGSVVPSLSVPSVPTGMTMPSTNPGVSLPATTAPAAPAPAQSYQPSSTSVEPSTGANPPRLLEHQDRMTARPIQRATIQQVSAPVTAAAPVATIDFDGWSASN